ncbi:MAG: TlpA family protein disulfide reductase [Methylococcaceae bacterium]|nr:TlpA family protein disulfide reductase [Methylococcaceae bacterium]
MLLLILVSLAGCERKHWGLEIGDPMPSIALTGINGKPVKLPDDFKGKTLLLRFWSMDCHFCDKGVLLAFEISYQKFKAQGFVPIAINESHLGVSDNRLKQFASLTYPFLYDPENTAARRFGVVALPVTYVFDEEGILSQKLSGEASIEEFEKLFTTVINKGAFYDSQN